MGIPHFSALSDKRKKIFLENYDDFIFQEKVDGSYLKYKLDQTFPWATRKAKNGPIYTSPNEWGTDFWVTGFRAAHTAFIQAYDTLSKTKYDWAPFSGGETIEAEVLFCDSPNTIVYGEEHSDIVIFSPCVPYYVCKEQVKLDDVPYTEDGFTIERMSKIYDFNIGTMYSHNTAFLSENVHKVLATAKDLELDEVGDYLVKRFVNRTSLYTSTSLQARIEGLVLKHPDGWMFKLVDRNWFTAKNAQNYLVRHKLFKSARGHKKSVMDGFWGDLAAGETVGVAATKAEKGIATAWDHYLAEDRFTQEPHIHKRNLEAFASIRHQLKYYKENGVKND